MFFSNVSIVTQMHFNAIMVQILQLKKDIKDWTHFLILLSNAIQLMDFKHAWQALNVGMGIKVFYAINVQLIILSILMGHA